MLYFSVISCIRQCFIIIFVYTIRGIGTPYVFTFTTRFGLMWPSSGTVDLTITFFSATLPTLVSVYTLGVRYMCGFM
jgi:hypothetical protein